MADSKIPQGQTTLCAIMKNEGIYFLEWLAFHRLVGFDRFVIYSNDCTDGSDQLLDQFAAAGLIEHRRWPSVEGQSPQKPAYNDAIKRCETTWISFIDADEFMVLKKDATIGAFLKRFPADVSAIAVNWRLFGSGGHMIRTEEPVIERFTRAAPRPHHLNRHCKTIARAADVQEMHIHACVLRNGRYVDSTGRDITIERMGFTPSVEHGLIQVNHYVLKSVEEFQDKQRRGNANRTTTSADKYTGRNGPYFDNHDRNEELDESMLMVVPKVLAEMERLQTTVGFSVDGLVA